MYSITLPDTLQTGLTDIAVKRGESLDSFVVGVLETLLNIFNTDNPKSLRDALIDARTQIEAENTPLLHTWADLDAEIADRRGGSYQE